MGLAKDKLNEDEASPVEFNRDLDEVFQIGNIGPEDKITRLDRMRSISVGDAIRVEEGPEMGYIYIVKSFGFERFNNKEAA